MSELKTKADAAWLRARTFAIEDIVRKYRIPPELLTERGTLNVEEDNHE